MRSRKRNVLIELQAFSATTDAVGHETQTWGPVGGGATATKEWAQVFYGRGDERRQAAMEQGQQAATFQVLSNAITRALTIKSRVVHDGADWDIEGIAPDTPERGLIEVTATRPV